MESELLFVCHANICRSPMAERLARAALRRRPELRSARLAVSSAGTHAQPGSPMHPPVAEVLHGRGVDTAGFRSRPVDPAAVATAALVLTASRLERAAVVRAVPSAVRRTFTVREFARLAGRVPAESIPAGPAAARLAALIAAAPRARADGPVPQAADDDLADPVQGTLADVGRCADEIERCLDQIWTVIATP